MTDMSHIDWSAMSDDRIIHQIGEFVRYHRMEQNKTQAMLAHEAGISRSTLSLLERGETVTIATLVQVLRVLDQLQVIDNFTITPPPPSPILLARAEKEKRQRVMPAKKKSTEINNETDW